ncbi:hypothetical protein GGQ97_000842 [Sphingomonas kaistensis]|uniref:Glycosyltransferase 2-like domain-containing protein n=1 Tax=Sphingomonas kaistensis TaxID=298708 RepID=A0A7X6BF59_9SPHN|nr:glycosyltransferase family 2 protein [Sphingomonas kaistensis]NJC05049.1 hypothetical protein [Sphingomonas kaistensis]
MKLSVALATYNGAAFIAEQLASLAGQTRLPDELVISDDGSTDATLEIVKAFAAGAPFPVVIAPKSERLGFSDNFLFAAEQSSHQLIAFCDQDDVWLPRKLELGAGRVEADDSMLSLHTLTVTDELLRPTGFEWDQGIERDAVHQALELDPYATGWGNSMVFRRELLRLVPREVRPGQPNGRGKPLSHDTWIYMLAAAFGRVSWLKQPLLLYRQHGGAATVSARPPSRRSLLGLAHVPIEEYRAQGLINGEMASLMAEAAQQPGPFQQAASLAAVRFGQRSEHWRARAAIFDAPSVGTRAAAYRSFHRDHAERRHWVGAHVKDVVVGVLGLGRAAAREGGSA